MKACLVAVRGRWPVLAITRILPLACLAMALTLLSAWSTVVAGETQGFVVLPNSAPCFSVPVGGGPITVEILATREQTGGVAGVWRYTSIHGGGPPLHIHRTEDEFFYVLSGDFNFQLGDYIKRAPAGSFIFIPKDMVHTFQHVGPEPGVLLGVVTPGWFEGLFQALQGADAETAEVHVKNHGMAVVGPPIEATTSHPRLAPPVPTQLPAKVSRIGVLSPGCPPPSPTLDVLLQGLRDLGYVDGQTVATEWRYSEGKAERFPELAAELAQLQVDLIVAVSTPAALAAKHATSTIPIVMVYVADPVGTGLVTSLGRPGGNLTGVSDMATDLSAKRLELLKEAVPTLSRVAVLWNAADPGMILRFREIETAARVLGLTLQSLEVRSPDEFERAFAAMTQERPDGLFVVAEVLTLTHRYRVLDFAAKNRLPAIYEFGVFAREGGAWPTGRGWRTRSSVAPTM